jgi:acetoin utilization deacetylase AcuC-like enzyme
VEAEFIEITDEDRATARLYIDEIHSELYRQHIKFAAESGCQIAEVDLTPESFEAAETAVALSLLAAQPIIEGNKGNFAVVRPPGHHASKERASGFCLFNNVACAVEYLTRNGLRVAIIDIDIHHGDGTQSIFYDRNDVFYSSIHKEGIYPYTGKIDETGIADGIGYNQNIPLSGSVTSEIFIEKISLALEKIKGFKPDVLAISAGFDTYKKDRLLGGNNWQIDIADYEKIGWLIKNTGITSFAVLEGGYHTEINACLQSFLKGINS